MVDTSRNLTLLFKYGGNAMVDDRLQRSVIKNIAQVRRQGHRIVIVHGGGPFIRQALSEAGIQSEFVEGQRVTSQEAIGYVEMALKGRVNGRLVALLQAAGHKAVGLSGKDGRMVTGTKRVQHITENGQTRRVDMGQVADVRSVDTTLLELLLDQNFIPVIACLATDDSGSTYNVNADMFAGHVAGALKADHYIVLTDVDGLMTDINDPGSVIRRMTVEDIEQLKTDGVIAGGMIPKLESCAVALRTGAQNAMIANGTRPELIPLILEGSETGTTITG